MTELADLIRWCNKERATQRRALEMMEAGEIRMNETRVGLPERDATAEAIARAKTVIAELDVLLGKHAG